MRFHYKNEIYEKEGENWPMKNILLQYVEILIFTKTGFELWFKSVDSKNDEWMKIIKKNK